jgi:hypothetical protein
MKNKTEMKNQTGVEREEKAETTRDDGWDRLTAQLSTSLRLNQAQAAVRKTAV